PDRPRDGGIDRVGPGGRSGGGTPRTQREKTEPVRPAPTERAESLRERLEEARRQTPAGRGDGGAPDRDRRPDPVQDQNAAGVREQAERRDQETEIDRRQQDRARQQAEAVRQQQEENRRLQEEAR